MSANYHVKVQSVEENCITFELFLADDSFACFADPEFALRLLGSPDDMYKYNEHDDQVANCPLAEEVGLDDYLDENWIDNNTHLFIEDLKLVSLHNFPYTDWDYDRWGQNMPTNQAELDNLAKDHPGGVLSIKVFNPKHLEHFKTGMIFSTAAYSTQRMGESHYDSLGTWIFSE